MLLIFDVDGTLIKGERADWSLFEAAIQDVTGFTATADFWARLEEVTSESILRAVLADRSSFVRDKLIRAAHDRFDALLEEAILLRPGLFAPREGVPEMVAALNASATIDVALATGEWRDPILKKLRASGLEVGDWPLATSSERCLRHNIIAEAARRAGRRLEEAIYVGDGLWDLRAARILGIPFVGVGDKTAALAAAGAERLIEPMRIQALVETVATLRRETRRDMQL